MSAFQGSSAEKASFSIRETAAGTFSGQPAGELSTVSAMDIMCAPIGIAAAQDGSLFVTDIYNKVIWIVKNGKSTVYAGGSPVTDLYGQPLDGYNNAGMAGSYFSAALGNCTFSGRMGYIGCAE